MHLSIMISPLVFLFVLTASSVFAQSSTPAAIAASAAFDGFPKWALAGVIIGLKNVYKSLSQNVQQKAQQLIDDNNVTVNQLINKLGAAVDGMSTEQQAKVRDLLTAAEEERRESAVEIESGTLTDEAKQLYGQLIDIFTELNDSLSVQCSKAQSVVSSALVSDLNAIGVPENFKHVNCEKMSGVLFN